MLIIGLVGGTEARREAVADQLTASRRVRFARYAMKTPEVGPVRMERLRDVVLASSWAGGTSVNRGLVITHVLTADEADFLRSRGGQVWHLEGVPSDVIAIARHDLLVTHKVGGSRHYLDPLEAVSEALLRYHAAN